MKLVYESHLTVIPDDELVMQTDGDLVFYVKKSHEDAGHSVWSSNTKGHGSFAILDNDGNFAIYTESLKKIWESKKDAKK